MSSMAIQAILVSAAAALAQFGRAVHTGPIALLAISMLSSASGGQMLLAVGNDVLFGQIDPDILQLGRQLENSGYVIEDRGTGVVLIAVELPLQGNPVRSALLLIDAGDHGPGFLALGAVLNVLVLAWLNCEAYRGKAVLQLLPPIQTLQILLWLHHLAIDT